MVRKRTATDFDKSVVSPQKPWIVLCLLQYMRGVLDQALLSLWRALVVLFEKLFVTVPTLSKKLDTLEKEGAEMPSLEGGTGSLPELEVMRMDQEKLEIQIKNPSAGAVMGDADEPEVFSPVEVVHDAELPKLTSILKCRNHTTSESSCDDPLLSSYSRQSSALSTNGNSEESLADSDDNEGGSEVNAEGRRVRKKSVSFSEHVDRTTYKANMSVTTMKATLKSKRRRARKKEQKQNEKQERRRRRNSNSISEPSSDDQNGHRGEADTDDSQDEGDAAAEKSGSGQAEDQEGGSEKSPVVKSGSLEVKCEGKKQVVKERTKAKIVDVKSKERTSENVNGIECDTPAFAANGDMKVNGNEKMSDCNDSAKTSMTEVQKITNSNGEKEPKKKKVPTATLR